MLVSDVKDLIKSLNIFEDETINYYCGILDQKKEKSLGFYKEDYGDKEVNVNGKPISIKGKQIQILIHWNKNYNETEIAAQKIYKALEKFNDVIIENKGYEFKEFKIFYLDLIDGEPLDYNKDPVTDTGVFQQGIRFRLIYTE
ncbi:hypothetical protein [uncultured Clostridium sp.]|uniref:hypothetical protein n=1 Tax=uncultured Clostridium sp. TaxID=59620 RepID=UPI002636CA3E|nr:hypothetical protein [uncultured Clostridium sp.]